jgi:putative acetyltransferase
MVEIREERAGDAAAIGSVHLAAFSTPTEANLVEQLRSDGDITASLIAIDDGEIVGHVLFSRMSVEADGRELDGWGLAPVAVMPDRQRTGIGSALVEAGIGRAQSTGVQIIFVLGEPAYYGRFGFDAKGAAGFASPYAGRYFQARQLANLPQPLVGRADYAPAFAGVE